MQSPSFNREPAPRERASKCTIHISLDNRGRVVGTYIDGPMQLVELVRGPAQHAAVALTEDLARQKEMAS